MLLVDEAQNLSRDSLKLVHYLLNFETATEKLLQIALAGQEELTAKILKYQELASRMFPISMNAMSVSKLEEMIRFCWLVAGGKDLPFPEGDGVYKVLYAYSKGLPRHAVKVCDEVLRYLAVNDKHHASAEEVEQIAQELKLTA